MTLRGRHINSSYHSQQDAWHSAHVELEMDSLCLHAATDAEKLREAGLSNFSFKYEEIEFTVEGPLLAFVANFKQEVNRKFKAAGGRDVRGARTALQLKVDEYLEKVSKVAQEQKLVEPSIYWAKEDHFKWLIYFQIPPDRKTFSELSRAFQKDRKSVKGGVKSAATLIGLTIKVLPEETWRARAGRPPQN
jgi:hypothetical protein